jgi:hypothetical protein
LEETMSKKLSALLAAGAIAMAAVAAPTTADARHGGRVAAGVIGGLAAGAIIGGALAAPYYHPAPTYYYDPYNPYYYGPACHWRRVWTPWGWRRERVCY